MKSKNFLPARAAPAAIRMLMPPSRGIEQGGGQQGGGPEGGPGGPPAKAYGAKKKRVKKKSRTIILFSIIFFYCLTKIKTFIVKMLKKYKHIIRGHFTLLLPTINGIHF